MLAVQDWLPQCRDWLRQDLKAGDKKVYCRCWLSGTFPLCAPWLGNLGNSWCIYLGCNIWFTNLIIWCSRTWTWCLSLSVDDWIHQVLVCTSSIGSRRNVIQTMPWKDMGQSIFRMSWNTRSPGTRVNCLVFLQLDPRMARMPSTMRRPETTPPGSRLYLVAHVCKFPCISYYTCTLFTLWYMARNHGHLSGKSELIITKDRESRRLNFLIICASWKSMTPSFATLWCTGRTIDCGCQEGRLNKGGNLLQWTVGWCKCRAHKSAFGESNFSFQWAISIPIHPAGYSATCQHWFEIR